MSLKTEPYMLVMCSEIIELIEAQRKLAWIECEFPDRYWRLHERFEFHYNKASKNLAKFNRQTLVN